MDVTETFAWTLQQNREEITAALDTFEKGQLVLRRDGTFDTLKSLGPDNTNYPVNGEKDSYTAEGYYLSDSDRDEREARASYDDDIVAVIPLGATPVLDFAVPTALEPGDVVSIVGCDTRATRMTVESVLVNRVTCTWFDSSVEPHAGPYTAVFLAATLVKVS